MNIYDFTAKWGPGGPSYNLNERQGAQTYFSDLCNLLGVPQPSSDTSTGANDDYTFEKNTLVLGEARGYADVFKRGAFAWENKAPGKDLNAALRQLQGYSLALSNPPLLVVCDRLTIRIHTQFTGHPSETHEVTLNNLAQPDKQALLRRVWLAPESFRPQITNRDITEKAAKSFATLADSLRKRGPQTTPEKEQYAEQIAHFLTQTLFCFFAEDVGLLPDRMFEKLVNAKFDSGNQARQLPSEVLTQALSNLFKTMDNGGPFGVADVPWFNGSLFKVVNVPKLEITDITELRAAAALNWRAIDVSIFGTLFERGLDPTKRSQLGAHYTDPATIERIIEPVVRRPLLQKWELLAPVLKGLLAKSNKKNDPKYKQAHTQYVQFLDSLADFKILDPACGSGNFLFLGLKTLKDIEHYVITEAEKLGLERPIDLRTSPANMRGIELNEYAAELARVTVWIGELQWRLLHGYPFKTMPVLEPLNTIEQRDALLSWNGDVATEAEWPKVSVVIGNPPFLGDRKMIRELGETYTFNLRKAYENRVPGGADLVCYWFEKARYAIEKHGLGAAGLVATNSIRGGANRKVLDAISKTSRIYQAWSDYEWVNEGASVRVSLVAFGHADQPAKLDDQEVAAITADLSASYSVSNVEKLKTNANSSYIGTQKNGPFDIPHSLAADWLRLPNPHGKSNARVLRPWANGLDVTRRPQNRWVVDFGCDMPLNDAMLFEAPFAYVDQAVKPTRLNVRRDWHRENWWLYGDARPGLRAKLSKIDRFIVTPMVAKHRVFAWMPAVQIPENLCVAITRADDTTMGILHSRFHELWSLRMGTSLEDRPRYTPTTCFETFPFPASLTPADTAHQRTSQLASGALIPANLSAGVAQTSAKTAVLGPNNASNQPIAQVIRAQAAPKNIVTANNEATVRSAASAIAEAAKRLNDLRSNWLNPPEWTHRVPEVTPLGMASSPYPERILPKPAITEGDAAQLQKRTLTNLYNQRAAGKAQWLATAHAELDAAVANAYGWADYTPAMPDEEILSRLLALNLERSNIASSKAEA